MLQDLVQLAGVKVLVLNFVDIPVTPSHFTLVLTCGFFFQIHHPFALRFIYRRVINNIFINPIEPWEYTPFSLRWIRANNNREKLPKYQFCSSYYSKSFIQVLLVGRTEHWFTRLVGNCRGKSEGFEYI